MKVKTFKVEKDGICYTIEIAARKITVSPGETYKITKLKRSGNMFDQIYDIPLEGSSVQLHIDFWGKRALVSDGINQETGEAFQPMKIPAWAWIFVILGIVNFFVIGGALGGAVGVLMVGLVANVSTDMRKNTFVRVLLCTLTIVGLFIAELLLAGVLYSLIQGIG